MGRGKRIQARPLRLTDLWKGRRTPSSSLPLSADSENYVASLIHDSSSNTQVSSSSSSTVGQPAFNVMQGSSDGVFPSSFPSAPLENNNLRQPTPALVLPDLSVLVPSLSCHHDTPPATSAPPSRPSQGRDTGLSTSPAVTPTPHTNTRAPTNVNLHLGVRSPFVGAQEKTVGIQPESTLSGPILPVPPFQPPTDNSYAHHLPDPSPVRPVTTLTGAAAGPRTYPTGHGTADPRPLQPPPVAPLTVMACADTTPTSPPRGRQGTSRGLPPPAPDPSFHLASPLPAPDSPLPTALPCSRKRPLTLHDYWCPDRPTATRSGPHPPCRCPPSTPGGRRHHGELRDGDWDRPRKTSRAAHSVSEDHSRAPPVPAALSPLTSPLRPTPNTP